MTTSATALRLAAAQNSKGKKKWRHHWHSEATEHGSCEPQGLVLEEERGKRRTRRTRTGKKVVFGLSKHR